MDIFALDQAFAAFEKIISQLLKLSTRLSISSFSELCYAMPLSDKAYSRKGKIRYF